MAVNFMTAVISSRIFVENFKLMTILRRSVTIELIRYVLQKRRKGFEIRIWTYFKFKNLRNFLR